LDVSKIKLGVIDKIAEEEIEHNHLNIDFEGFIIPNEVIEDIIFDDFSDSVNILNIRGD
jgi:hypothetical protein